MRKKRFFGENQEHGGAYQSNQNLLKYLRKCSNTNTVKDPTQLSYNDPWSDWINYPLVAWPELLTENAYVNHAQSNEGQNKIMDLKTPAYVEYSNHLDRYPINPYNNQDFMFSPSGVHTDKVYNFKEVNNKIQDFTTSVNDKKKNEGFQNNSLFTEVHSQLTPDSEEDIPRVDGGGDKAERRKETSVKSDINLNHGLFPQQQKTQLNNSTIENLESNGPIKEQTGNSKNKSQEVKADQDSKGNKQNLYSPYIAADDNVGAQTDYIEGENRISEVLTRKTHSNDESAGEFESIGDIRSGNEGMKKISESKYKENKEKGVIVWKNFPK